MEIKTQKTHQQKIFPGKNLESQRKPLTRFRVRVSRADIPFADISPFTPPFTLVLSPFKCSICHYNINELCCFDQLPELDLYSFQLDYNFNLDALYAALVAHDHRDILNGSLVWNDWKPDRRKNFWTFRWWLEEPRRSLSSLIISLFTTEV